MVHRSDDDRRLQGQGVARRDPVADVGHRPEIPWKRPLLVRRCNDRHLHARPVGMRGGQLADARRHADGVGDGVRVDVGIARIRRVGHRCAPRLRSELAGRDHERARQRATNRAGRGRVNDRREPDAGKHNRADVERHHVPGGLVREGREDPRGDGNVAGEIPRPEGGFGAQTLRRGAGHGPRRQRTDDRQHEDQPLAPPQAPRRRVREESHVVVPRVRVIRRVEAAVEIRAGCPERLEDAAGVGEKRRIKERGGRRCRRQADDCRSPPSSAGRRRAMPVRFQRPPGDRAGHERGG